MAPRFSVQVEDTSGKLQPLVLAVDDHRKPIYASHLVRALQPSVVMGEAGYGAMLADRAGVYAQSDLSGGLGKKMQVPNDHADAKRYYYAEGIDASVPGQIQKGPATTTLTAPSNSGTLTSSFELGSVPYLVLSRRIASWATDTLTARKDFGASVAGSGSATFVKLGTEASIETQTTGGNVSVLDSADDRIAQQIRTDDAGVLFLSKVELDLVRTGTVAGDVRLTVQADLSGRPSGTALTTARQLAANVPTVAGTVTFRFDDDEAYAVVYNEPFWIVLDAAGATGAANKIEWTNDNGGATYTRGAGSTSGDAGNIWSNGSSDYKFTLYAKTPTETAFVGVDTDANLFVTSTDGASYTADDFRSSTVFRLVGDRMFRDVRTTTAARGGVQYTDDGTNWSETLVIGDLQTKITMLLDMAGTLIVCKTDSVWAVDPDTLDTQLLHGSTAVTRNGLGSCVWKGKAFIPWNGRLMAVEGDFDNGFTVHTSVGPESMPEWDSPWGAGSVAACQGDRFHLYAAMSATGGYRLLKVSDPIEKKDWHGSLATLGDGTQTIQYLAIHDPGFGTNPQLFFTTTGNDIGRVTLPRSANPASDSSYSYDISTTGTLDYARAHGNFFVNPKAWLYEAITFQQNRSGDYAEVLYDTLDSEGYRRMPYGRLYDTGVLRYPAKLASRLLARRLQITNSAATASPLILATGVTYAVRQVSGQTAWEITFVVEMSDGMSGVDLGDVLGIGQVSIDNLLERAAAGDGTRAMIDPWGRTLDRVLFIDAQPVLGDTSGAGQVQITALALG